MERTLKDQADKIPAELQQQAREQIELVGQAQQGDDLDALEQATANLQETAMKIGEAIYQTPPAGGDNVTS